MGKHWQCDAEVQIVEEKPWKNEALPRLKECHLEEVSRLYKAKTGRGCDGFHLKVPLDLTKETRGEIVNFLENSVVDRSRYRKANVVVSPHAAVLPLISLGLAR